MDGKRAFGQVWTPPDIAQAMASWCARTGRHCIDPAAGSGRLLDAASARHAITAGVEIDEECPSHAHPLIRGDFLSHEITHILPMDADWICNPPYLRHASIETTRKHGLHTDAQHSGLTLRRTVGLHAFFVHKVVQALRPGGRASFLLPTDLFEGISASNLLPWLTRKVQLVCIAVLQADSEVFKGVDTRGIILFMQAMEPMQLHPAHVKWASIDRHTRSMLDEWVCNGFCDGPIKTSTRPLQDVLTSPTRDTAADAGHPLLGSMATVTRGLVAGYAPWSVMTSAQAIERGLPVSSLRRIIRRAGDIPQGDTLNDDILDRLDASGIPTFLFSPQPVHLVDKNVQEWIKTGECMGLPEIPSLKIRGTWWRAETRRTPAWLFSYFGGYRRRFIKNDSSAAPLTSHLCIYPKPGEEERLTEFLQAPSACDYLDAVGKCHGKSIKVEPRALERLALRG